MSISVTRRVISRNFQITIVKLEHRKGINLSLQDVKSEKNSNPTAEETHSSQRLLLRYSVPFFFPRVRKPRKRTMAQSKNRLVLAIKRHSLSLSFCIRERKICNARCTVVKHLSRLDRQRFEHNVFSPAFADITQGNLARTCSEYIPLHVKISILYTRPACPLSSPVISSISPATRRQKAAKWRASGVEVKTAWHYRSPVLLIKFVKGKKSASGIDSPSIFQFHFLTLTV